MIERKNNLSGQCQCGNIRYRVRGEPLTFYTCHCLDCQKQSVSAFGLSMWVMSDEFELMQASSISGLLLPTMEIKRNARFVPGAALESTI